MLASWAAALLTAVLVTGCTSPAAGTAASDPVGPTASTVMPPAQAADLAAPTGFGVSLDHTQSPAPGPNGAGKVSWRSSWALSWEPVPGASSYAVYYATNEGAGDRAPEIQTGTTLTIDASAGTSPTARVEQDRSAGLLFTASQLLVSVAAQTDAGPGPRSLWFPVGEAPPDGRPLGTAKVGDHGHDDDHADDHADGEASTPGPTSPTGGR